MSDKTTMKLLLEARFQQLAEDQRQKNDVPAELRKEVFRTLDLIENPDAEELPGEPMDNEAPPHEPADF